jgi:crossover junction endodeoxyribonuclease RuvC
MIVLGVDPGLSGGIAILEDQTIHLLADMPIHRVGHGKATRPELDMHGLCALLARHRVEHVVIEQVGARPGQGTVSMFRFGYAAGALYGAATALGLPVSFAQPKAWQRFCGIGPHPDEARRRASQLYPAAASQLNRKVDANKADALLIGRYGQHLLAGTTAATAA